MGFHNRVRSGTRSERCDAIGRGRRVETVRPAWRRGLSGVAAREPYAVTAVVREPCTWTSEPWRSLLSDGSRFADRRWRWGGIESYDRSPTIDLGLMRVSAFPGPWSYRHRTYVSKVLACGPRRQSDSSISFNRRYIGRLQMAPWALLGPVSLITEQGVAEAGCDSQFWTGIACVASRDSTDWISSARRETERADKSGHHAASLRLARQRYAH